LPLSASLAETCFPSSRASSKNLAGVAALEFQFDFAARARRGQRSVICDDNTHDHGVCAGVTDFPVPDAASRRFLTRKFEPV
jgi:hypothetical protein